MGTWSFSRISVRRLSRSSSCSRKATTKPISTLILAPRTAIWAGTAAKVETSAMMSEPKIEVPRNLKLKRTERRRCQFDGRVAMGLRYDITAPYGKELNGKSGSNDEPAENEQLRR